MTSPAAGERLNRYLARRGVASRRGADELIAAGRVRVNGAAAELGTRVEPGRDVVSVNGAVVAGAPAVATTLALHKPAGVVTTRRDPQGRPTVMSLLPNIPGLVPVGRLDADSRGLLLVTTDGELAHRVAHPRYGVHKRYRMRVEEQVSDDQVRALTEGVTLDDGPARALSASRSGARGVEVVMGEGRKREVRRLCAAVGLTVIDLLRTAVGPVRLGELAEGESRPLSRAEDSALRRAVQLGAPDG